MKKNYPRNPSKCRLSMEMPVEMHNKLREIAQKHNVSITNLVTELIESLINYENKSE